MYMYIHTHRSMEVNVYKNYCIYVPLIWQYCIAGKIGRVLFWQLAD